MINNLKNKIIHDLSKTREVLRMKICRVTKIGSMGTIPASPSGENLDDVISYAEAKVMYGELLPLERVAKTSPRVSTARLSVVRVIDPIVQINGRILTEEQVKQLQREVEEIINEDYVAQKNEIINSIPSDVDDFDKIRRVFDWFVENVFYWDNHPKEVDGSVKGKKFSWKNNYPPNLFGIDYNSKEGALLLRKTVCQGMGEAFQDVLSDLGIQVETVSNKWHVWNMFYTAYGPLYIDISQCVRHISNFEDTSGHYYTVEAGKNRYRYFAKTLEDLNSYFPHFPHSDPAFTPYVKEVVKTKKK